MHVLREPILSWFVHDMENRVGDGRAGVCPLRADHRGRIWGISQNWEAFLLAFLPTWKFVGGPHRAASAHARRSFSPGIIGFSFEAYGHVLHVAPADVQPVAFLHATSG